MLKAQGVDLITASGGGFVQVPKSRVGSGYQLPFAEAIRRETGMMTGAMGMITEPRQADQIVRTEQADLVVLARQFLREPYFPLRAAQELGHPAPVPKQYLKAFPG